MRRAGSGIFGDCPAFGLARKIEFLEPVQADLPCPVPLQKIFPFRFFANHFHNSRRLNPLEGRIAIVTDAGWDAMDAAALLTNGAKSDGEVVWS
jgi:hypothetical protein